MVGIKVLVTFVTVHAGFGIVDILLGVDTSRLAYGQLSYLLLFSLLLWPHGLLDDQG